MSRKHKAFAPELPMEGETFALVGERCIVADSSGRWITTVDAKQREMGFALPAEARAVLDEIERKGVEK